MSDHKPPKHPVLRLVSDSTPAPVADDVRIVSRGRYFGDVSHPNGVPVFSATRRDGSKLFQCFVFSDHADEIEDAHVGLEQLARDLLERDDPAA